MRLATLLWQLASATLAAAVLELTPENFDKEVLQSGRPSLVKFYAPWCGHCKNMAPTYDTLGTAYAHASSGVLIAKLDADAHKDLGKRFGVQGFPTLKWFDGKSDKPEDYNGGRDLGDMTKFIEGKTSLKPKVKKTESNVVMLNDAKWNSSVGAARGAFVAFTAPWCGHCKSLAPVWEKLTDVYLNEPSVLIAKVDAEAPDSTKTAAAQGIKGYPTIKWFAPGSTEPETYSGGRTVEALVEFVNSKANTFRGPDGRLTAEAGLVAALDALLAKGEAVAEAAKAETHERAAYYARVAEKLAKNAGYVDKELARVQGILGKGAALAAEKVDDLTVRMNILQKFKAGKMADDKSDKSEL